MRDKSNERRELLKLAESMSEANVEKVLIFVSGIEAQLAANTFPDLEPPQQAGKSAEGGSYASRDLERAPDPLCGAGG
jgi:hypothetical protein